MLFFNPPLDSCSEYYNNIIYSRSHGSVESSRIEVSPVVSAASTVLLFIAPLWGEFLFLFDMCGCRVEASPSKVVAVVVSGKAVASIEHAAPTKRGRRAAMVKILATGCSIKAT